MLRPDSTHLFVVKYGDQCAGDATESGLTAEQQSDANVFIFFRNDLKIDCFVVFYTVAATHGSPEQFQ